jgi:hypothetical protein
MLLEKAISNSLLETLAILPKNWRLVPVNGNKQPLGCQWQKYPFSPTQMLLTLSKQGYLYVLGRNNQPYPIIPSGVGILLGQTKSDFLIALDVDGHSAHKLLKPIPPTISFTSGRAGRCQHLFRSLIPISPKRIITAPGEGIEIRAANQQSVLPPSPHPLTGYYRWLPGCRPDQIEVAIAPDWIVELGTPQNPPTVRKLSTTKTRVNQISKISVEMAKLLLSQVHPRYADDYGSWIRIGMSLHHISFSLLPDWDNWSQLSPKYIPGECHYKWASFKGKGITDRTLFWYAIKT